MSQVGNKKKKSQRVFETVGLKNQRNYYFTNEYLCWFMSLIAQEFYKLSLCSPVSYKNK